MRWPYQNNDEKFIHDSDSFKDETLMSDEMMWLFYMWYMAGYLSKLTKQSDYTRNNNEHRQNAVIW